MITKSQFEKMKSNFITRRCPICNYATFQFYENRTNMLTNIMQSYETIDVSNITYISVECMSCGYIMNFNLKKLLE